MERWPCPWPDPCTTIGDDVHQLDRPPHGKTQPGAPYEQTHHHDHTACTHKPKGWHHPNDPEWVTHECGPMWTHARRPIERMWPPVTPWRVLATAALSTRTRRARAIIACQRLADAGVTPQRINQMDDAALADIIEPVGLVNARIRTLREIAAICAQHPEPSTDQIRVAYGVGDHIIDAYRVHVLGDTTEPFVNVAAAAWAAIQSVQRLP